MKNFIISFITVILGVLVYIVVFRGISIFQITVPSVSEIKQMSSSLDQTINKASQLVNIEQKQESEKLDEALTSLLETKKEYEKKLALFTPEEIEQVTTMLKYDIEYLWAIVGNYASKEGVELKLEAVTNATSTTNNLNFTLNGSYIDITDFIADIEEDESLQFKVENLKLIPGGSVEELQATFTVRDIAVTVDNISNNTDINESLNEDVTANSEQSEA